MKYVITMIDGEWQAPVPMDKWLCLNLPLAKDQTEALTEWIDGLNYRFNKNSYYLIDLPV